MNSTERLKKLSDAELSKAYDDVVHWNETSELPKDSTLKQLIDDNKKETDYVPSMKIISY